MFGNEIEYGFNVVCSVQHVFFKKTVYDDNFWRKFILNWRKFAFIWRKIIIMKTENMDYDIKWFKAP